MREFGVQFVEDDALPNEQDWVIVKAEDKVVMVVKRSRLTPRVLSEAWVSFRRSEGDLGARMEATAVVAEVA